MPEDGGKEGTEPLPSKRLESHPREETRPVSTVGPLPPPRDERGPGWTQPPGWDPSREAVVCSVSEPSPNRVRVVHVARHGVWREGHVSLPEGAAWMVGVVFDFTRLTVAIERKRLGRDPGVLPRKVQSVGGWLLELRAEGDGDLYARVDVEGQSWRVPVTRALFDEVRGAAESAVAQTDGTATQESE